MPSPVTCRIPPRPRHEKKKKKGNSSKKKRGKKFPFCSDLFDLFPEVVGGGIRSFLQPGPIVTPKKGRSRGCERFLAMCRRKRCWMLARGARCAGRRTRTRGDAAVGVARDLRAAGSS